MRTHLKLLALAIFALHASACNIDPYCLECIEANRDGGDGGGGNGDGGDNGDGGSASDDAYTDATRLDGGCTATGPELCNGIDDNCNGTTDEGDPGGGQVCSRNVGECREGITACQAGRTVCVGGGVSPMPESCDNLDNDCDGTVDNGDPGGGPPCGSNVGECRRGTLHCTSGSLQCQGATGPQTEACNGRDDDCDNMIDEGVAPGGSCGTDVGQCTAGMMQCIGGQYSCTGAVGGSAELCNSLDDDCDGMADETFSFTTDPRNCGGCGTVCGVPDAKHAVWSCAPVSSVGTCVISYCQAGYYNLNGSVADGCEYACNYEGAEICNGEDDDCDGMIDDGLVAPAATFCRSIGACAGATVSCDPVGDRWVCNYGANVELDAMGNIVSETRCDNLDNDCDGLTDEAYPTKGTSCGNGIGACRRTVNSTGQPATFKCASNMTSVTCDAVAAGTAGTEVCDGIDNDCDNSIDETKAAPGTQASYVVEPMVLVGSTYVYQYEASRPDSTSTVQGSSTARACSRSNIVPWVDVTYAQASAACTAAGARLCTEAEWQAACVGGSSCAWGMQSCTTYSATQCNGNDYDAVAGSPDDDAIFSTGNALFPMCRVTFAGGSIYDLSGNVKEWTQARSAGVNPLRGGSYNNTQDGLRCDFNFSVADDTFKINNVGFRCCSGSAP